MDPHVEQQFAGRLLSGERVLWSGRPGLGIRVRHGDIIMIPFSLAWAGFVIFWLYRAFQEGQPFFFRFWGIPFLLIGAYLVMGRFPADARRRGRTYYCVTDQRVIVLVQPDSCTTFNLRTLPGLTLTERPDGTGDVVLANTDGRYVATGGWVPRGSVAPTMLEFLESPRNVYDIISRAQQRVV